MGSRFYVGQKLDAKDSINNWCLAVVLQVSPARILVHYEGWSAKWDEWFDLDSPRLAKAGEYSGGPRSEGDSSDKRRANKHDDVVWAFFVPTASLDAQTQRDGHAGRRNAVVGLQVRFFSG